MKKIFILSFLTILSLSFSLKADETVEYHFQEGFTQSTPSGWIRTCNATTSTVHTASPALSFAGAYAIKFDAATPDDTYYLQTPEYNNAGTLSFYIAKNANNTLMDLYVQKIVNGVSTEIKTLDAYSVPNKSSGWQQISINVNETQNVKFKFYSTIREGNTGWFAIDDIELTKMSGTTEPPAEAVEKVTTNFGDGTWGEILTAIPAIYPSNTINGFYLDKAVVYTGSATCSTGEKHTNRVLVDKSSNGGLIELPPLKTVGEIEIHAATGTDTKSFILQEYDGSNWNTIGTYDTRKTPDSVYVIQLIRNVETKLRIANNTGSGLYIYKIATRTYQESMELNITSTAPAEGSTCYYNLTKNITLSFNKEVNFGIGNIILNGVSIPVSNCTIDGKTVSVPVTLEGSTSGKTYTVTIPQGAFVESGNTSVISNLKTFTFQTYKTVAYPINYSSQIDVLYSTANIDQNRMDIYYPTTSEKPVPVVINIHGGGWNHGEKESQSGFNVYFNMGMAVANIEYRMTPQATAPAAVEDARCAMMYLLEHASELNIDPNKIIFQGGSAGGHLALTAGYLQNDSKFDAGCHNYSGGYKVIAVIDKYGPSDLTQFMFYSSLVAWLGDYSSDSEFVKSISPVSLIGANTPPTYIIHGDADPTVPYSQSELLYNELQKAGIRSQFTTVPGGGHGDFPAEYNTQMNNEVTTFLTNILEGISTAIEGNKENDTNNKISVSGYNINIYLEGNTTTDIFDTSGRKVLSSVSKEINIANLISGSYIVKATAKSGIFTQKFIK